MAQVRMLVGRVSRENGIKQVQLAGDVIECSDADARRMIEAGQAEPVMKPPAKKKTSRSKR
jgi:hypothetical protein